MIDIPVRAEVQCTDGNAGRSTYVIVNPINQLLTHLVVKDNRSPFAEHVVPVEKVEKTTPDSIQLSCTREELGRMEPFVYKEYLRVKSSVREEWRDSYLAWPYIPAFEEGDRYATVKLRNIPLAELAVRRGARVQAADGYVGQVEELLVNSENMHVTHLVLREKHLWKRRDVTIPVSQIDRVKENSVYLKLDRAGIKELPTVPVQRWSL
jgi:hypothetical protein